MRLTLIAAAVIAATAGSVQAETYSLSNGEDSVETNSSFSTENGEVFAVSVTGTGNASFTGTSFAASSNYTLGDKWNAAVYVSGDDARTKPNLVIGNSNTQDINITSQGAYTVGLWAWKSGQLTVEGKDLVVHVTADLTKDPEGAAYGILAQNNSTPKVLGDVNNETIGHANLKNRSERTESLKRK